ncbi:MAG: alanine--tRNA ligase-related protein, partial [Thermoplasmata archaeon]
MSELAYLEGPDAAYVRSFEARVVALPPGGVVLDRTFFYPEGGGQPSDTGELAPAESPGLRVVGVLRSGSGVIHRLARRDPRAGLIRIGAEVTGTIDWPRRYAHMRAHTAQHLLSARLFERTGRRTRSARLHAASGAITLEGSDRPLPDLREVVEDFEIWVGRALPVTVRFMPRSEYERQPGARSGLRPL